MANFLARHYGGWSYDFFNHMNHMRRTTILATKFKGAEKLIELMNQVGQNSRKSKTWSQNILAFSLEWKPHFRENTAE